MLRGSAWGERAAEQIRRRGGDAQIVPLLEIHFADAPELREALGAWTRGAFDWLLLTSMNTVHVIERSGADLAHAAAGRIAAVGPSTAETAEKLGLTVSLVPDTDFTTEGLLDVLRRETRNSPARFLFPVSNLTDDRMQQALEQDGHEVVRITAYDTQEVAAPEGFNERLRVHAPSVILVTSGSAARALHHQTPRLPPEVIVAAIGQPTARALAAVGFQADVVASRQTLDGLLDATATYLRTH